MAQTIKNSIEEPRFIISHSDLDSERYNNARRLYDRYILNSSRPLSYSEEIAWLCSMELSANINSIWNYNMILWWSLRRTTFTVNVRFQ